MKQAVIYLVLASMAVLALIQLIHRPQEPNLAEMRLKQQFLASGGSRPDHSQFPELQKAF